MKMSMERAGNFVTSRLWRLSAICLMVFFGLTASSAQAVELSPDNPDVQRAVEKAANFLEQATDNRLGAKALAALTLIKCGRDTSHPKVQDAVKSIQEAIKVGPEAFNQDIYSTGISILCLVAVDASRYRTEIDVLAKSLHYRQKQCGAWGYPVDNPDNGLTGDTSMTQYASLGLWEAEDQAGVITPPEVWDKLASWVLLTQDPNGGFAYQGTRADDADKPVKQGGVRLSMTVAGMVSLYIVKDRLGISELKKSINDETPPSLRPFETQEQRAARIKTKIPLRYFARSVTKSNTWLDDNLEIEKAGGFIYYYLYALERVKSLVEADQRGYVDAEDNPDWYQKGAKYILSQQDKLDGKWEDPSLPVPSTCFATLFLLRSTKKNLEKSSAKRFDAGELVAGRHLPDQAAVRLRDGRVVVKPLAAPAAEVFKILENPRDPAYTAAVESLADLAKTGEADELAAYAKSLAKLTLGGEPNVRILSVQTIGRSRNLELVPVLIHVLEDDNAEIVSAAHDSLKAMSRANVEFESAALADKSRRAGTIEQWKSWYQKIRPDVDLQAFDPTEFTQ